MHGLDQDNKVLKLNLTGLRAAVGFESGKIHVVDLKTNTVLSRTPSDPKRLHGHQYSVLTIDCHLINNTLISGSKSGQVIISSASTGKVRIILVNLHYNM